MARRASARRTGIVVYKMTSRALQVSFPSEQKGSGHSAAQSRTVPGHARHDGMVIPTMTSRSHQVSVPSEQKGNGHLAPQPRSCGCVWRDGARRAGIVVHKMTSRPLQVSLPSKIKGNDAEELLTPHGQGRGTGENDGS